MQLHRNAKTTPRSRLEIVRRLEIGQRVVGHGGVSSPARLTESELQDLEAPLATKTKTRGGRSTPQRSARSTRPIEIVPHGKARVELDHWAQDIGTCRRSEHERIQPAAAVEARPSDGARQAGRRISQGLVVVAARRDSTRHVDDSRMRRPYSRRCHFLTERPQDSELAAWSDPELRREILSALEPGFDHAAAAGREAVERPSPLRSICPHPSPAARAETRLEHEALRLAPLDVSQRVHGMSQ